MSRKKAGAAVKLTQEDLVAALVACAPAATSVLPGTSSGAAALSVADGKLRVQVASPDLLIRRDVPASGDTLGPPQGRSVPDRCDRRRDPVLCSHRWLLRLAKALPKGNVTLAAADGMLHLASDRARVTLGLNVLADDVEPITLGVPDDPADGATSEIPAKDLIPALRTAVLAASTDQQRAVLCAVQVTSTSVTATDSYRLHSTSVDIAGSAELGPRHLWPRDFAAEVAKIDADETPVIRFGDLGHAVSVQAGETLWASTLVQGEYPAFDSLWPREPAPASALDVTLPRAELAEAVKRIADVSDGDNRLIRFRVEPDAVTLAAAVSGVATGEQRIDGIGVAPPDGSEGWLVGFNGRYLEAALSVFAPGDLVRMVQHDAGKPAVFTAPEHPSRVLLMPVRLP